MSALAFLPPSLRQAIMVIVRAENRDERFSRAAEHIEADADKVRELVEDNIDAIDSPICSDSYTVPLMIALRELTPMFKRLCHGDTLEQATKTPDEAQHWRTLLRFADDSDAWIAKLIDGAAAEEVDAEDDE